MYFKVHFYQRKIHLDSQGEKQQNNTSIHMTHRATCHLICGI